MARLEHLAAEAGRRLLTCGMRLAIAESCTGGWLCKLLTDAAGSSAWLERGVVAYSNAAKIEMLGVESTLLISDGAVSERTVCAMAVGLGQRSPATVVIAASGISGPGGGSALKPVGTVWIAWMRKPGPPLARCFAFDGGRDSIRRQTVAAALQMIIDALPER